MPRYVELVHTTTTKSMLFHIENVQSHSYVDYLKWLIEVIICYQYLLIPMNITHEYTPYIYIYGCHKRENRIKQLLKIISDGLTN